ncbi:hypothetical protein ACOMHN_025187 [Nucella lapillus]
MPLLVGRFPVVLARVAVWGDLEVPPGPYHNHHKVNRPAGPATQPQRPVLLLLPSHKASPSPEECLSVPAEEEEGTPEGGDIPALPATGHAAHRSGDEKALSDWVRVQSRRSNSRNNNNKGWHRLHGKVITSRQQKKCPRSERGSP